MKRLVNTIMFICLTAGLANAGTIYNNLEQTALAAGVHTRTASMLAQRAEQAGFTEEDVRAVENAMTSLYQAGAQSAAEKVLEGIAKNIPAPKITMAVTRVRSRYENALKIAEQAQVSTGKREHMAEISAETMAAGATPDQLSDLAKDISSKKTERDEYAEEVMSLYRDMVRHGIESQRAHQISKKVLSRYSTSEIKGMHNSFREHAAYSDAESMAQRMEHSAENGAGGYGHNSSSGGMGGHGGSGSGGSGGGGHGGGGKH